jgi:hypothetical protein
VIQSDTISLNNFFHKYRLYVFIKKFFLY